MDFDAKYFEGKETEDNWKQREEFWRELNTYLRQSYQPDEAEAFVDCIQPIFLDLIKTTLSLRTSLAVLACQTTALLCEKVGREFEPFAETTLINMLKLCSGTKKIVVAAATEAAKNLTLHCGFFKGIAHLALAMQDKNPQLRLKSMELLDCMISNSGANLANLRKHLDLVDECLRRALTDANKDVRQLSRDMIKKARIIAPSFVEDLVSRIDPNARKQLESAPSSEPRRSLKAAIRDLAIAQQWDSHLTLESKSLPPSKADPVPSAEGTLQFESSSPVAHEELEGFSNISSLDDERFFEIPDSNGETLVETAANELELDIVPLRDASLSIENQHNSLQFFVGQPADVQSEMIESGRFYEALEVFAAQEICENLVLQALSTHNSLIDSVQIELTGSRSMSILRALVMFSKSYWQSPDMLETIGSCWNKLTAKIHQGVYLESLCALVKEDESNIFLKQCILEISQRKEGIAGLGLVKPECSEVLAETQVESGIILDEMEDLDNEDAVVKSISSMSLKDNPFVNELAERIETPSKLVRPQISLSSRSHSFQNKSDLFQTPKTPFQDWKLDRLLIELERGTADLRAFQKLIKLFRSDDLVESTVLSDILDHLLGFLAVDITCSQKEMALILLKHIIKQRTEIVQPKFLKVIDSCISSSQSALAVSNVAFECLLELAVLLLPSDTITAFTSQAADRGRLGIAFEFLHRALSSSKQFDLSHFAQAVGPIQQVHLFDHRDSRATTPTTGCWHSTVYSGFS